MVENMSRDRLVFAEKRVRMLLKEKHTASTTLRLQKLYDQIDDRLDVIYG